MSDITDSNQLPMNTTPSIEVPIISQDLAAHLTQDYYLWAGDTSAYLDALPEDVQFDLVVTSPPYNLGKEYEEKTALETYLAWQTEIIQKIVPRVKDAGSICWQVGNYVENGTIWPLDISLAPIFQRENLKLRNRIVWRFGHGLHNHRRFSGRYEVILWFTKTDGYTFNLDPVRIPSKYPGKKHHKGPKAGQYSGNPRGKNPEDVWEIPDDEFEDDVWEIPNVKSNHVEKTIHPCQFPVGLIERLLLSLTNEGDLVFDPFAGVASAGVAAAIHHRRFWGTDIDEKYLAIGKKRIEDALAGQARYRPHDKPIYDHTQSKLSQLPIEFSDSAET